MRTKGIHKDPRGEKRRTWGLDNISTATEGDSAQIIDYRSSPNKFAVVKEALDHLEY